MKKSVVWMAMLVAAGMMWGANGAKVVVLPQLYGPSDITVDEERIYITQRATIFIFARDDYRLMGRFGKKGEGPGEFKLGDDNTVFLAVRADDLLVNSVGRISYFNKDGTFIKERINTAGLWLEPLGTNFVGMKRQYEKDNTRYRKIYIYNANLEKGKEIYREFDGIQPRLKIIEAVTWPSSWIYNVGDGKIFVANKEETIHVFDEQGDKLYDIRIPYKRIKVTPAIKEKYLRYYREVEPYWRARWERLKGWYRFPDYLPVIQYYVVKDGHLYVLTYREQEGKSEFLVLDEKGNLIQAVYVNIKREGTSAFNVYPFDIKDNTIYQLVDNADTEQTELHIIAIKAIQKER